MSYHLSDVDNTGTGLLLEMLTDTIRRVGSVIIRRNEILLLRNLRLTVLKKVVLLNRESILLRVKVCDNRALNVNKSSGLHEDLSAHARVHSRGGKILITAAVNMCGSETNGGSTAVDVTPVVVVVSDVELAGVLITVAIAMADETGLPVVRELVP